jgi:hypothetical protein
MSNQRRILSLFNGKEHWQQFLNRLPLNQTMKTSFLDYYKLILDKVSFDKNLLRKEYSKAMTRLPERDRRHLDHWLRSKGLL